MALCEGVLAVALEAGWDTCSGSDCVRCGTHSVCVVAGDEIQVQEVELAGGGLLTNPHLAEVGEGS